MLSIWHYAWRKADAWNIFIESEDEIFWVINFFIIPKLTPFHFMKYLLSYYLRKS